LPVSQPVGIPWGKDRILPTVFSDNLSDCSIHP